MKCSICESTTHLRRFCPQGKGKGKSSSGKVKGTFPAAHLTINAVGSSSSSAMLSQPFDMSANNAMANMAQAMQTGTNNAPSWFASAMQTTSMSGFHGYTTISVFEGLTSGPGSARDTSVSRVSQLMRATEIRSGWTEESEQTSHFEYHSGCGYDAVTDSDVQDLQTTPEYIPDFE